MHKIRHFNIAITAILERHFPHYAHFMSNRIKNKLANRRIYGVEQLVRFYRRGNLTFRQDVFTLFLLNFFTRSMIKLYMRQICDCSQEKCKKSEY